MTQKFGDSVSIVAGKVSAIDLCASKPFMGGAGVDSFWNMVFVAPPSGTVPAYFLGGMLNVTTEPAAFSLWVYDPNSVVNTSGLEEPFKDGITFRGSASIPVSIAGRGGHQVLTAAYSNQKGKSFETLGDIEPKKKSSSSSSTEVEAPSSSKYKYDRYYASYSFDQYLYQSKDNPKEGVGIFGQFGVSDGNPNWLHWMGMVGIGGTGLIPGRSLDNWGIGYFYAAPAPGLKAVDGRRSKIGDEQCLEIFYNFAVTPWFVLGADVQVLKPSKKNETAVFPGLRLVVNF